MPWAADMAEDESPAPDQSCRTVHCLILLLVPGAGHAHRVEEYIPIKLNLSKIFSWHIHTSRQLFAHPCQVEEEAGQAEEVDQGLWDLICLLLQPGEHSLSLQEELWKDVNRGRLNIQSHPKKGGNSRKDGRVVLVCNCLLMQSDLVISYYMMNCTPSLFYIYQPCQVESCASC